MSCRFVIQLDEHAPGGAWCQCATHGGSGPARCGAVATEFEKRILAASITAGAPGETVAFEAQVGKVLIRQLPIDSRALRVSIGETPDGAAYLVFRGGRIPVLALLERALGAMRAAF